MGESCPLSHTLKFLLEEEMEKEKERTFSRKCKQEEEKAKQPEQEQEEERFAQQFVVFRQRKCTYAISYTQ